MTLQQFIQKYQNTRLDLDGFPKGSEYQCWDLAQAWFNELGLDYWLICKWSGGVKDIWEHRFELFDENEWEFEQNERLTVPYPGDIVVWNGTMGGGYGHIGIVVNATVSTLNVLEQNAGQGDGDGLNGDQCRITKYSNWNGIYGFIRPKALIPPTPLILEIPKQTIEANWIGNNYYENLINNNNTYLAVNNLVDRDNEITSLKNKINELEKRPPVIETVIVKVPETLPQVKPEIVPIVIISKEEINKQTEIFSSMFRTYGTSVIQFLIFLSGLGFFNQQSLEKLLTNPSTIVSTLGVILVQYLSEKNKLKAIKNNTETK